MDSNVFMGDSSQNMYIDLTGHGVPSNNLCDPTMLACPDANAAGECTSPDVPYAQP